MEVTIKGEKYTFGLRVYGPDGKLLYSEAIVTPDYLNGVATVSFYIGKTHKPGTYTFVLSRYMTEEYLKKSTFLRSRLRVTLTL